MSKVNKNLINFALGILGILAVGVIFTPNTASAQNAGRFEPYQKPKKVIVFRSEVTSTAPTQGNNMTPESPEVFYEGETVVYQNSNFAYGNLANNPPRNPVAVADDEDGGEELKDLTANALFGGNSFAPSGLTQWLMFAVLVLLLVVIFRKAFGKEREYLQTPLKHS